jgi:hypothetical protein
LDEPQRQVAGNVEMWSGEVTTKRPPDHKTTTLTLIKILKIGYPVKG